MSPLPIYTCLYYTVPRNEFEQLVNDCLDELCIAARGGGFTAISAQTRLRYLKTLSTEKREEVYKIAVAKRTDGPIASPALNA
jgi:hypothetical protein